MNDLLTQRFNFTSMNCIWLFEKAIQYKRNLLLYFLIIVSKIDAMQKTLHFGLKEELKNKIIATMMTALITPIIVSIGGLRLLINFANYLAWFLPFFMVSILIAAFAFSITRCFQIRASIRKGLNVVDEIGILVRSNTYLSIFIYVTYQEFLEYSLR